MPNIGINWNGASRAEPKHLLAAVHALEAFTSCSQIISNIVNASDNIVKISDNTESCNNSNQTIDINNATEALGGIPEVGLDEF